MKTDQNGPGNTDHQYRAKNKGHIVGMSALLPTTMQSMRTTLDALTAAGLRNHVIVIIGGAPVTEAFAQQIEADGFSPDASRAVNLVNELLGK